MSQALSVPWLLGLVLALVPAVLAAGSRIVDGRRVGVGRELSARAARLTFGAIGFVAAVLLAFVDISAWEQFSAGRAGQTFIAKESSVFQYAERAKSEVVKLRVRLVDDLEAVIASPAIAFDWARVETTQAIDGVHRAALALNQTGTRRVADLSEVFAQIAEPARQGDLRLVTGLLSAVNWSALLAGAGLTVIFTLFFGGAYWVLEVAMTAGLSSLLTSEAVTVIVLARETLGRVLAGAESG